VLSGTECDDDETDITDISLSSRVREPKMPVIPERVPMSVNKVVGAMGKETIKKMSDYKLAQ
jgi:hypothetical protein